MKTTKRLMIGGLAAGLLAGGGAGMILTQTGLAGAADSTAVVAVVDPDTTTDTSTDSTGDSTGNSTSDSTSDASRSDRLREVLQPLVDDGTLTAAQLDAVVTTLEASRPEGGHGGRHGGPGMGRGGRGAGLEAAATALGVEVDALRDAVRDGQTIAEIAAAEGVAVQTVIDAMVAEATEHLAEHVAAGDMTQEEADAKLVEITTRITDVVNNGRPARGAAEDATATTEA
jgi:polyhydroxyalkanoate synthesis regulator phasin